jgi:arylsulfatase
LARRPSIVLILADDLGYGDVGCFGAKDIRTPNIDRLARDGMRLTDFYVSQAVCTASRASLMTGCYANRVGMAGALNHTSQTGIHPRELLLSEICQQAGYATGGFGKWHLGTLEPFNPLHHGFDEFLGIPYSNDNSKYHPVIRDMPPLPLLDGIRVVEKDPDQSLFTRRFTERAVAFVEKHKDRPFFLYVPHVMPHVPIFASEKFRGQSGRGLYGDVVEELDWSVGEIVAAIDRHGLAEKTLVIFLSDNGPFLSYGDHAGSPGLLREGKLTTFEGGMRSPCVMRWPGKIPAGSQCGEVAATIDLLPTIAKLVGRGTEENWPHTIDGRDIGPLVLGKEGAKSPHETYNYYSGDELQAVRSGRWKLHFPHDYLTVTGPPGRGGKPAVVPGARPLSIAESGIRGIASRHGYGVGRIELSLFDLADDPGEKHNVAAEHPEVVTRLSELAQAAREDLGDSLAGVKGENVRPAEVRSVMSAQPVNTRQLFPPGELTILAPLPPPIPPRKDRSMRSFRPPADRADSPAAVGNCCRSGHELASLARPAGKRPHDRGRTAGEMVG